jgi:hypothetical protein
MRLNVGQTELPRDVAEILNYRRSRPSTGGHDDRLACQNSDTREGHFNAPVLFAFKTVGFHTGSVLQPSELCLDGRVTVWHIPCSRCSSREMIAQVYEP